MRCYPEAINMCAIIPATRVFLMVMVGTGIAVPAFAQHYPTKPIRLIVPFAPGGSPDITSRQVANELSRQMGQQVVVDNRVGAAGIIGTELIARAVPDGYTLGYLAFPFATNPSLFLKLPYDSAKDFQPVASMLVGVNLLAVSPSLSIRSIKELIDYARLRPDKLTYAGTGGHNEYLGYGVVQNDDRYATRNGFLQSAAAGHSRRGGRQGGRCLREHAGDIAACQGWTRARHCRYRQKTVVGST